MGKTAIITGGGRGIGRAITLALSQKKFNVVITYVTRRDNCEQTAIEVRKLGCEALVVQADVTRRSSVHDLISAATKKFGTVEVLVNNAGILQQKPFSTITDEEWDTMLATNLKSVFLCSQEIMPIMAKQGGGSIINISSSGGQLGGMLAVHYGLIETEMSQKEIRSEVGQQKIGKDIPLRRAGQVEEVATAVAFLASDEASYITGQSINVNGGLYMG